MGSTTRVHTIAVIPGDGIGLEVTAAAIKILRQVEEDLGNFELRFTQFDWNSENYLQRGYYIPEDGLASLATHDAILLGAVGSPGTVLPPYNHLEIRSTHSPGQSSRPGSYFALGASSSHKKGGEITRAL